MCDWKKRVLVNLSFEEINKGMLLFFVGWEFYSSLIGTQVSMQFADSNF